MNMYESIKNNLNEYEDDFEEDNYVDEDDFEEEDFIGETKSSSGIYFGDPCYVMYDDIYDEIWGDKYGYSDGVIKTNKGTFVVHGTAWGDGEYGCTASGPLAVDSGTLALVPKELIDENKIKTYVGGIDDLGHYMPNVRWASLSYKDGAFKIDTDKEDSFVVNTK